MISRRHFEVTTVGTNDALQGISTDPFLPNNNPSSVGLRVPSCLPGVQPGQQPRYLFNLASFILGSGKVIVRGIRQGLTIGLNVSGWNGGDSSVPLVAEEFLVTTPYWSFVDGNVSWHLVKQPSEHTVTKRPNSDAASWGFRESDSPAMLYEQATFQAGKFNVVNSAPNFYADGLLTYKAPYPFGATRPIAGLGNLKDIRFPWNSNAAMVAIDELVEGPCKITLYASVLQTNPSTRAQGSYPTAANTYSNGISPETAFVRTFAEGEGNVSPVQYWRVFGSILFEELQENVAR